ncbi:MAG: hypothetical protein J3K34DRAFT_504834 [Monoraphidium minutum]|nr:MAG: hypothetical protein J3K34DRAFT_504834 [Monoraphidium minutum]
MATLKAAEAVGGETVAKPQPAGAAGPVVDAQRALLAAPVKARKLTLSEALPSALHLAATAAASMAVFVGIYFAAQDQAPPKLRASLACITVSLIAMPQLGNSVVRGFQRIIGVMIGGWLFCGIYLAYQARIPPPAPPCLLPGRRAWWFLGLLLGAFTFLVVALSHVLVGKQYLYPPMVVCAFVVCVGFSTPRAAIDNTVNKTCGIASGILVYTLISSFVFPRTATQQLLSALGITLHELRDLADAVLRGRRAGRAHHLPHGGAAHGEGKAPSTAGRESRASDAMPFASASTLVAAIPVHLREVQGLVPDTHKEKFVGRFPGGFMCYVPAPVRTGSELPFRAESLAVAHVIHMLHRTLWLLMAPGPAAADAGAGVRPASSLLDAALPKALGPDARGLLDDITDTAVAALKEFAATMPAAGRSSASAAAAAPHVVRYRGLLAQLQEMSLQMHGGGGGDGGGGSGRGAAAAPATPGGAAAAGGAASAPRARWQRAISSTLQGVSAGRGGGGGGGGRGKRVAALVDGILARGDVEAMRWCGVLLLLQQLGNGLGRLQDCMDALLPHLPGAPRPDVASAPASGVDSV